MKKKSVKKNKKATGPVFIKSNSPKGDIGVYHLLVYVEDCSSKIKKFTSIEDLNEFIFNFTVENPDQHTGDNWIDYVVTDVVGEVLIFEGSGRDTSDSL